MTSHQQRFRVERSILPSKPISRFGRFSGAPRLSARIVGAEERLRLRQAPTCRTARHWVVRRAWLAALSDAQSAAASAAVGTGELEHELNESHDDLPQSSPA